MASYGVNFIAISAVAAAFLQTAAAAASTSLTITTSTLPSGSVNAAYSQSLAASGGTAPYSNWTVSTGTLPVGLTLSSAGLLSGTPAKAGASSFKVTVADSAKGSATASLTLTVTAALAISTGATLTAGKANVAYTDTLAATGGTPPYSGWTVSGGAAPQGLKLTSAGVLSGTPTAAGTFNFTVSVTDHAGTTASASFQLTIAPGKLSITTTSPLPAGQVNVVYSESLAATGGTTPYTAWSIASGNVPSGLTLESLGLLGGAPTTAGAYTFTVQVTDSAGATASMPFQLTIANPPLQIATPSPLPQGQANASYSQTLTATGGTPPYAKWSTTSGTLPVGLTLSASGVLSGTPTNTGVYSFTVQVSDKTGTSVTATFQLTISQGPLMIATTSPLPTGRVNINYSQSLMATGGRPPYTWAVNSGVPGLSFSTAGVWSGTPSSPGIFNFTAQVADSAGATLSAPFQLTVSPSTPVTISTTSPLPSGNVNSFYVASMAANFGTAPYTNWTVTAGTLPPGLTLSTAGVLSGTPTNTGSSSFTVQVTDSGGVTASAAFQVTISPAKLAITTSSPLPAGKVNSSYSQTVSATGGLPPYTWGSNSTTPGLTFSSAGVLSGTPTSAGAYSFTIQVTDSAAATASVLFQLTIGLPALAISTSTLPAGQAGTAYSQVLAASGGTPPYTWAANSTAPGITLNSAGVLSGTPASAGTYSFNVQVTDKAGAAASSPLQLIIAPAALTITTGGTLPSGRLNTSYSLVLAASGGTPPYSNWSTSSGTLPAGLTLSSTGVLSGTPTAAGAYTFTIHLTDNAGGSASAQFQLTINASALAITTASPLPPGRVNSSYSQAFTASGGTPPYVNWSNSSGALPSGLTLNSAGVLSGTPTTAGTFSFTIQVTDSASGAASTSFQLTVSAAALTITTSAPLPAGQIDTAYSATLTASGGTPPYAGWTTSNGALPAGLTLSSSGTLSGTPTTAGTFTFTVQVTDKAGASASTPFQLTISSATLTITSTSPLPAGKVNTVYSATLAAGGGTPPYTNWIASTGTLPAGLMLSSSGTLSGTPTAAGTYSFTIQVTDKAGTTASTPFQLTITPAPLTIMTVSPLPAGKMSAAYAQPMAANGGTPPYTWSSSSTVPGLTLSTAGMWSGTPTAAGNYSLTVQVQDSAGVSASAPVQLTINSAALVITTASPLPSGRTNFGYSQSLTATGGTPPYSWSASGAVPGLTFSAAGVWSGMPSATGTYSVTVQVMDSAATSASASFQLSINPPAANIVSAVSSASSTAGLPVTPGSWVAFYGSNLAPAGDSRLWNPSTEIINGKLPSSLDGTSVTVNGKAASVEYISPGQVNIQMPDDATTGPVPVVITTAAGGAGSSFTVTYAQFSPGFFPATAPYIAAQHADNSYVTASSPAAPGEVIVLWGGGMGPANPPVPSGQVFAGANPLANTVSLTIGGQPAIVSFAGVVGAGLVQINVQIPVGIGSGDQAVMATVGGVNSPPGTYISVGTAPASTAQLRRPAPVSKAVIAGVTSTVVPATPIYAGTDNGIYKSSDAGATWQLSLSCPGAMGSIQSIVVDALHPERIYAGGVNDSGGAFFTSLDAGQSWSEVSAPRASVLALDATSTNVIYLLGVPEGEVYKSEDSGRTWSPTSLENGVTAIAADPRITGAVYVIASTNQLMKSYDFGTTWTSIATGVTGGITGLAIGPDNSNTFYVISPSAHCTSGPPFIPCGVWRSTDGGNTWLDLGLAENSDGGKAAAVAAVLTDPGNVNNLYLLPKWPSLSGNSNGLFRSRDRGASWSFSPVLPAGGKVLSLGIAAK